MPVPVATVPTITSDMSPFDAALALARAGFHVFPVDHPELPRCVGIRTADHDPKTCGTRGKHTTLKYTEAATTDLKTIASWWAGAPRNVGIFCGASSLVVVDEDAPGELDRFAAEHQVEIPPTLVVATSKGRHFYSRARPTVQIENVEG